MKTSSIIRNNVLLRQLQMLEIFQNWGGKHHIIARKGRRPETTLTIYRVATDNTTPINTQMIKFQMQKQYANLPSLKEKDVFAF